MEVGDGSKIVAGPAWYWGVNKDKEQEVIDASIQFLTWMYTDEEAMTAIIDDFEFIPAYTNFSSDDISDPLSNDIYTYLTNGQTVPWSIIFIQMDTDKIFFGVQFQAYAADQISWAEFTDQLKSSWAQERQ